MSNTEAIKNEFELDVVFSDDHLIIVNKPIGIPVSSGKSDGRSLLRELYLEFGETDLRAVNRVDQPVSGLVVIARGQHADSVMSELFRERKVRKEYWAAVQGKAPGEQVLEHLLLHDKRQNKSYVSENTRAKLSKLAYVNVLGLDNYSLLLVTPETGRHHQIRVQLAAAGFPIKGDVKYGARRGNKNRSIHLHARRLVFDHPITNERVDLVANPMEDPLWALWPQ